MERAAKLLRQFRYAGRCMTPENLLHAAWHSSVGKVIVEHTRVEHFVGGHLIIAVDDELWRAQLTTLSQQIKTRLTNVVGEGLVRSIEFRVVPRKRPPARAAETVRASTPAIEDEADKIEDPILSRIYRASRKRTGPAAGASQETCPPLASPADEVRCAPVPQKRATA